MGGVGFGYHLEYAGFRIVAAIMRALPLETASDVMGWLWRRLAPRFKRHRRALAHLAAALPETSEAERERIARDMWETLGRVLAESFHLDEIVAQGRVTLDPQADVPPAGRFVAAAPHMGNWEVAAVPLAALGARGAGIYQRIKNPLVDAYVRRLRAPLYPGGLYAKHENAGMAMLRHLRAGGVLATMADLRDRDGAVIDFFGRPARASTFPALAARATGAPLFAVHVLRLPRVRFVVQVERIDVPRTADRDADVLAATKALHAAFERAIRAHPEQWMWAHRRWG